MPTIDYYPLVDGISTGLFVRAIHINGNTNLISLSINAANDEIDTNLKFREAFETVDYLRALDTGSFIGGTNELVIGANAITLWDKSSEVEVKGWPGKTLTSLTNSTKQLIWATYVSGVKDFEASELFAALPSNSDQKFVIGIADVDSVGAVTFTPIPTLPHNERKQIFKEDVTFLKEVTFSDTTTVPLPCNYHDIKVEYTSSSTITILANSLVRSSDNSENIIVPSNLVVDLSASGALGLDTGSEASSTWYYLYLIKNSATGAVSAVLSATNEASSGSITYPSGYDRKRQLRIAIRNDSSSDIIPFAYHSGSDQNPEIYYTDVEWSYVETPIYSVPYSVLQGGTSSSFAAVDFSSIAPPITTYIRTGLTIAHAANGPNKAGRIRPTGTSFTQGRHFGYAGASGGNADNVAVFDVYLKSDTSQSMDYRTFLQAEVNMGCLGYKVTEVA